MSKKPLRLTICVVSYNHEKYIAEALDSFLMQETDFAFQVIIGDDASTDRTPDILREYAAKYPDIIKPVLREKNIQPINNSLDVYSRAHTEFVAVCDGDDYWTDPRKLQKQVDFLDAHSSCSICFHPVRVKFQDGSHKDNIYPSSRMRFHKKILTLEDLATRNPIHTCSMVLRWRFRDGNIRETMPNDICPGDYYLLLLHAEKGLAAFLPDVMSVYRINSGGMSFELHSQPDSVWLKYGFMELNFYRAVDTHFHHRLSSYFRDARILKAKAILNAFVKHADFEKLKRLKTEYEEFYEMGLEKDKTLIYKRVSEVLLELVSRRYRLILAILAVSLTGLVGIIFTLSFIFIRLLKF